MSKASKQKAAAVRPATPADDAPVRPDSMSRGRRWTLIVITVFCLLIFSVTGPMADAFFSWFGPNSGSVMATMQFPDGEEEITFADYQNALRMLQFEAQLTGRRSDGGDDEALVYAALQKIADRHEVQTSTSELLNVVIGLSGRDKQRYENIYRSLGFSSALDFEAMVARSLRIDKVRQLLSASVVVSDDDVRKAWHDLYDEMRYSYALWRPAEFAEAAALLEPTEEELQKFFDEGLTPAQRAGLEREQAVAFELLALDEAGLGKPEVQALVGSDAEPSEAALEQYYNSRSLSLYRRPALAPGETRPEGQGEVFPLAEVRERVLRDFRLDAALKQAFFSLPGATDVAAFATQNGLTHVVQTEPIRLSELDKVPTYGSAQLRNLFGKTEGVWDQTPIVLSDAGVAYLMRPIRIVAREMPPLAEARDAVVGHWREKEQTRLAKEAAEAFVLALPKQDGWIEGDPVSLAPEAFAQALDSERRARVEVEWISRTLRTATDPAWTAEETAQRRARTLIGGRLKDLVDGQVIGPEDFGTDGWAVLHLVGRRAADDAQMWPNELQRARSDAQRTAEMAFATDQLSFEGLARSYGLTRVLNQE